MKKITTKRNMFQNGNIIIGGNKYQFEAGEMIVEPEVARQIMGSKDRVRKMQLVERNLSEADLPVDDEKAEELPKASKNWTKEKLLAYAEKIKCKISEEAETKAQIADEINAFIDAQ